MVIDNKQKATENNQTKYLSMIITEKQKEQQIQLTTIVPEGTTTTIVQR